MKRLFLILLMIVLASALVLSSCAQPASAPANKEGNLLVTVNAPLEWGGRNRVGNYYTSLQFVKTAAESGRFSSITVYFGAESADETAAGAFAALEAPMFPPHANLEEACRYFSNELGVRFVVPVGPIEHHGTTVADYWNVITDAEFVEIVANADISVGY
jgi:hypothetical protein